MIEKMKNLQSFFDFFYLRKKKEKRILLFFLPQYFSLEFKRFRFLPPSGSLVLLIVFYKNFTHKMSFFKYSYYFGICMSRRFAASCSSFILRNSYRRVAFEIRFFLYSPLLKKLRIFSNRRRFYNRGHLFFLRSKKIAYSRIFL